METIKLQKSQTGLLREKHLRILEAQNIFQSELNMIVSEELGIKDGQNWILSNDMTEIRKKEKTEPKPTTVKKRDKE